MGPNDAFARHGVSFWRCFTTLCVAGYKMLRNMSCSSSAQFHSLSLSSTGHNALTLAGHHKLHAMRAWGSQDGVIEFGAFAFTSSMLHDLNPFERSRVAGRTWSSQTRNDEGPCVVKSANVPEVA